MMEGTGKAAPGLVSTAHADYSTTEGNTRLNVRTDEYVMNSSDGKRITKTVTEERVTRYQQDGLSPSRSSGQSGPSPAQSQSSLYGQSTSGLSASTSQTSILSGEHISRSPNRSPVMWKPPSLSPIPDRSNTLQEKSTSPNTYQLNIQVSPARKNTSVSPVPKPVKAVKETKPADKHSKENVDPIIMSEQAKWEARQGPSSVPKFKLENFGCNTFPRSAAKKWESVERIEDPRYPMFDVFKPSWKAPAESTPPKTQPPPVAPKPAPPTPPVVPQAMQPYQIPVHHSETVHRPGMIKPPAQNYEVLQLQPAPPPPPMPPAPGPPPTAPKPKKFRPGYASTPKHRSHEELELHHHPDHLPVFAPKVYFAPEEDSGIPGSPTRSDPLAMGDEHSDISSHGASRSKFIFTYYNCIASGYPVICLFHFLDRPRLQLSGRIQRLI